MNIELVPAYTDRKLFMEMAKDYIQTLRQFDRKIIYDESTWQDAAWISSFILEDRTIQGFITKEEVQFKVFPDMLYIGEFYIVPEARKRGVGLNAVKVLMENWHDDVFLYILNGNFAAKAFWGAVEQKLGWKRISRPEVRQEENCELRVYQT